MKWQFGQAHFVLLEEQRRAMNAEHSISADLRIVDTELMQSPRRSINRLLRWRTDTLLFGS